MAPLLHSGRSALQEDSEQVNFKDHLQFQHMVGSELSFFRLGLWLNVGELPLLLESKGKK